MVQTKSSRQTYKIIPDLTNTTKNNSGNMFGEHEVNSVEGQLTHHQVITQ